MSLFSRGIRPSKLCRLFRAYTSASGFDESAIRDKFRKLTGDTNDDVELNKTVIHGQNIAVITLKNPRRKNGITGFMMVRLAEIVDELEAWSDGKGVILAGDDGFFCAGGDKTNIPTFLTPEGGQEMSLLMQRALTRLSMLPLISVAAVKGKALGGGAEIAISCDFTVMSEDAEIKFVHSMMGLSPPWGGPSRLVELIGKRKALELLLLCPKLDAKSAVDVGISSATLPKGQDIVTSAAEWLLPYLKAPAPVLQANKRAVAASSLPSIDQTLEEERLAFKQLWTRKHHVEALKGSVKH